MGNFLSGVGDVASGVFVGPQDQAAPLSATEKALRVILTLASSQSGGGIMAAHDVFNRRNAAQAGMISSPDFQALPHAEQEARLARGYNLPSLPTATGLPTPSEESKLEYNKIHLANETMAEAKKAKNLPDYYRAAGMTPPSGLQGAEVASVREGFAKADIEADQFASGPGGVSVSGEVRMPKQYLSEEAFKAMAEQFADAEGLAPSLDMGRDDKGYYFRTLSPSVQKAMQLAKATNAIKTDARREKVAETEGKKSKDTLDLLLEMKAAATPEAFSLQKPGGAVEGNLAVFNDIIKESTGESKWSKPRQTFMNAVVSNLPGLKAQVGQTGNLAVQEIEFLGAGLKGKGLSYQSVHETLDRYIRISKARAARANAAAGRPVSTHTEDTGESTAPTAKVGGGSTTSTGNAQMDAIIRNRKKAK